MAKANRVGTPPELPSDSDGIPPFTAWPLAAIGDSTVFLHDRSENEHPDWPVSHSLPEEFKTLHKYLMRPEGVVSVAEAGRSCERPQLSASGSVKLRRPSDADHTARGLVCFAECRRSISITLRGVSCAGKKAVEPREKATLSEGWSPEWFKSNYEAAQNPKRRDYWQTLREQCDTLFESVFRSDEEVARRPAHGLVILTGGTNSAKSQIARGLIHRYLQAREAAYQDEYKQAKEPLPRRIHLVTFEDPIETFWYGPCEAVDLKLPEGEAWNAVTDTGTVEARQQKLFEFLQKLPATLIAQLCGFDYTPREKGKDVHDLQQAFGDALRQTPSIVYVGEVRDPHDWIPILEFAGTGHLVITTAHAGTLLEAMMKILSAVGAKTAADRQRYASRILAVLHLRPLLRGSLEPPLNGRNLLLPSLWRQTEPGLAALAANGFGAIVPECPAPERLGNVSTFGRRWFARKLPWPGSQVEQEALRNLAKKLALKLDLSGE